MLLAAGALGQSADQNYPTPVRNNEIAGAIKARDIGDSRLTTHFYTFEGGQGDLFVNIQTTNFSGDIDIYVMPGLRPLSKIVVYPDVSISETGRVIYLRKPETILLRIEGRTPGDEEATYRIKFAGSFVASKADDSQVPEVPKVKTETESNIRVNSVGTIIEVIPKPKPAPQETVPEKTETAKAEADVKPPPADEKKADEPAKQPEAVTEPLKPEVVISDPLADKPKEAAPRPPVKTTATRRRRTASVPKAGDTKADGETVKTEAEADKTAVKKEAAPKRPPRTRAVKPPVEPVADPMANIRLVIRFKDGSVIERPMTEVSRFTVERAVLTVISKDGTIGRYKMIEVAGVTIE